MVKRDEENESSNGNMLWVVGSCEKTKIENLVGYSYKCATFEMRMSLNESSRVESSFVESRVDTQCTYTN